ncbi:MAG: hypothetical protein ACKVH8_17920 [Pirellulales bacterium]
MAFLGGLLSLVGSIACLVGVIWIIVIAFKESVLWGLGCLFVPFVVLIFAIMNWDSASKPALIVIGGIGLSVMGGVLAALGAG